MARSRKSGKDLKSQKSPQSGLSSLPIFAVWTRINGPVKHAICIGTLILLALVFFSDINFGGKHLQGSDAVQAAGMRQSMEQFTSETGEQALWAVNAFSGMPGYLIYYPLAVPQLDTIVRTLNRIVFPTFQFLVLVLGMYVLVYYLLEDRWIAVFASAAFSLTTYLPVILVAGHNTKFASLSFVPWLVLSFVYALRNPKIISGLLFAAALALNLRANHIQMTYYVAFVLGIWWIVEAVWRLRGEDRAAFLKSTAFLAGGAILGILMVAQPYWVIQEYKSLSIRGAASGGGGGSLSWDYAMAWSQGWGEMLTLLVADAYGGSSTGLGTGYWGEKIFTLGSHYIGGAVILFAIIAVWKVRDRAVTALGIGTLLTLLFALGKNASFINYPMFAVFPLFSSFRVPETWLAISVFGLVLLAAYGLREMFHGSWSQEQALRTTGIASGILLGLLGLLYVTGPSLFTFETSTEVNQVAEAMAQQAQQQGQQATAIEYMAQARQYLNSVKTEPDGRITRFKSDTGRTFLFVLLAGLLVVLYLRGNLPSWIARGALAILVMIDLGDVGARYFNADVLSEEGAVADVVESREYAVDRYIQQQVDVVKGPGHFRVLPIAFNPSEDGRSPYFYESASGYHGAKLRVYQDYLDEILFDPESGRLNPVGLDLLSIRYLIGQGELPGMRAVFQDPDVPLVVLERESYMPRASFVGAVEVIEDSEAIFQRLRDPGFNPRRTAILAESMDVTPVDSTSETSVELVSYDAHNIVWNVHTDAQRLFVAAEVYYPAGWTATIDDEPAEIHQTNYIQRGVLVPEGTHEIRMEFAPKRHFMSIWISGISTILVYGGILLLIGWTFFVDWRAGREVEEE